MPKIELSTHPCHGHKTYNQYIGHKAYKKIGKKKWNKRVRYAIDQLYSLFYYDHIYVGGGNARHITFKPDKNMKIISNDAGILGGIALWSLKKS
jgi:polyphosphate glucokinase